MTPKEMRVCSWTLRKFCSFVSSVRKVLMRSWILAQISGKESGDSGTSGVDRST